MCEYCEKPNKTIVTHITSVSAFVGAGRLWLRYYCEKEDRTYASAEAINYCPMCGRPLAIKPIDEPNHYGTQEWQDELTQYETECRRRGKQ